MEGEHMASYDYKEGKRRIKNILDNQLTVIEQVAVPKESEFTFDNGYYSWVTGIFVDIRNSSALFSDGDKVKVSKIIRCFTSEIIEILRKDDNLREIGIRGDCVYAVYTTPRNVDEYEVANKSFFINTYMKMLNKLLNSKGYPKISVGIGISTAQELIVKAGRKDVGINNLVWIGDAVTKASNLSSLGNKNGFGALVYSFESYYFFIDLLQAYNPQKDVKSWFTAMYDEKNSLYYHADIIKPEFDNWISNGMID